MFIFDIPAFVRSYLPSFLRKPKQVSWLVVLLEPMRTLWLEFYTLINQIDASLLVTVQTDILESALRVLYPIVSTHQVYVITNHKEAIYSQFIGEHHKEEYDYFDGEPSFTNSYDYFTEERAIVEYSVIVPTAYTSNELDIIAFIERYRPAGKTYSLIFQDI